MTIYQEVKLDSDQLFQNLLDSLDRDGFTQGIITLCCNLSSEDFEFERGFIAALQKFITENESTPATKP